MSENVIRLEMAHHPQAILDTMRKMVPAVRRLESRQRWRRYLGILLLVVGLIVAMGILLIVALPLIGFCLFGLGWMMFIASIFVLLSTKPLYIREHFNDAYYILYTLRDDTGRKGRVVGLLDLSGPYQKEKLVRTARSAGGKRKEYYYDPWFQAKIKLVDGNLLRLTLKDKVKVKANSVVGYHTQIAVKFVVNPNLYRMKAIHENALPLRSTVTQQNGICTIKSEVVVKSYRKTVNPRLPVHELLETLKAVYANLEPIGTTTA